MIKVGGVFDRIGVVDSYCRGEGLLGYGGGFMWVWLWFFSSLGSRGSNRVKVRRFSRRLRKIIVIMWGFDVGCWWMGGCGV